jgi:acyl carrier protein
VTECAQIAAICKASTVPQVIGIIQHLHWEIYRVELPRNEVCDRLIALVKQVIGPSAAFPDPFPLGSQLSDLGISSLKMVNLMLAVELEFDIAIPQSDITPENFQSVSSILALVEKTLTPRPN